MSLCRNRYVTHIHIISSWNSLVFSILNLSPAPWWLRWSRIRLQCTRPGFWLGWKDPLKKGMQPTSVFLPGEFHGQRSLAGYRPQGHKELDTKVTNTFTFNLSPPSPSKSIYCHVKRLPFNESLILQRQLVSASQNNTYSYNSWTLLWCIFSSFQYKL